MPDEVRHDTESSGCNALLIVADRAAGKLRMIVLGAREAGVPLASASAAVHAIGARSKQLGEPRVFEDVNAGLDRRR